MPKVLDGISQAFLTFVVLMMFVVPTLMYGSTIESALFPVVSDFSAVPIERSEEGTTYRISFSKIRQCDPRTESFAWYLIKDNGDHVRVNYESLSARPSTNDNDLSRPTGVNRGIEWVVNNLQEPYASQEVVLYHDCHALWRTKTTFELK